MDSSSDFRVLEFDTLRPPRPDGEKEALALLKQAAWQVQPIMKRRKWRILLLKELEPENMTRGARRKSAEPRRVGTLDSQPLQAEII